MPWAENHATPNWGKRLAITLGVGAALLAVAVSVVAYVMEQMEEAMWHR